MPSGRAATEVADEQLDMGALDAQQRIELVDLAPVEPALKLVGVERVGLPE